MNPFARKKWVQRQVNPVKDRLNELDQLNAKNANDIKDVDSRAQAGIHKAQTTADQATQQATAANAAAAGTTNCTKSSNRGNQLTTEVSNLDQYQPVTETEIHFRPGQTALNAQAKAALDDIAIQLSGKQGYILEVQGYASQQANPVFKARNRWQTQLSAILLLSIRFRSTASIRSRWEMQNMNPAAGTAAGQYCPRQPDAKQFSFDECACGHTFDERDASKRTSP